MAGFSVWLTKDGLLRERGREAETFVPADVFALLGVWHDTVEGIDAEYTLGDLFALLRGAEGIEALSPMLSCDVAAFLAEAERGPGEIDDGIRCLEVYNEVDLTEYEEDPDHPDEPSRYVEDDEAADHDARADALHGLTGGERPERFVDASSDDPITGKLRLRRVLPGTRNGRWVGPYRIERLLHGRGRGEAPQPGWCAEPWDADPDAYEDAWGVDFTPVNRLVHLPVRYDPAITFPDRRRGSGEVRLEDRITITFGELVHAIFWELGFLGSPAARDERGAMLHERVSDLKEMLGLEGGGREPWR